MFENIGLVIGLIMLIAMWVCFQLYCWRGIKSSTDAISKCRTDKAKLDIYISMVEKSMSRYLRDLAHNKPVSVDAMIVDLEDIQSLVGIEDGNHEIIKKAARTDLTNAKNYWATKKENEQS